MKTLRIYVMMMVLAMAGMWMSSNAQVLRDAANDKTVGRIAGNGVVRDDAFHSVGSFDADGTVRDANGAALGKIVRLEIFDNAGNRVGYINTDGTIRDGNSNKLGHVNLTDGKVTDADHHVLGYARGIRVDWIACYYFFDFFKKN
ncbi:MAG: hypothetical protein KBT09_09525 [Bacteroidales bacterium]|nr:hypothetical protein [Candidatus Sodaliphilus fimicaballi]